jgi:hypothetical protein
MANPLADALVRRVASVGDAKARVGLVRTLLAEIPPEVVAEAAAEIARRAGLRDTAAQLTLLALAAAQEQARPPVPAAEEAITSPEHAPDWGTGRPLTLGERKSLARRPDRRLLERALRDAHPDVIAELLQNPRLTEPDVARLCAAPDARPEVLTRVFANPRWATRPRVRRALASNPRAPVDLALALVPLLARDELREIAADARIANAVRARALEILRRLPPTPEGSGELH